METAIRIYRRFEGEQSAPLHKSDADAVRARVAGLARVQRPELLDFFLSGQFSKLAGVESAIVNNPPIRSLDYSDNGWTIPEGSLGKSKAVTVSTANSIVSWIMKHLVENGVISADEFTVVIDRF